MAPHDDDRTRALVDHVAQQCQAYLTGKPGASKELIESCTKLLPQLMTPEETMVMTTWAQPTHNAAVRLGVEMRLFEAMMEDGGSPKSSVAIADGMTPPAEHALVARMLRHMAAMGTVLETGQDTFAPTPYVKALTQENFRDTIDFLHEDWQRIHISSIDFFRQHAFKSPTSMVDSPFQHAYHCKGQHLFEYFGQHAPLMGKKFASVMNVWSTGRPKWFREDYYGVRERLIAGATPNNDATFLVDVGGGTGHDIALFKAAFAGEFAGKLVLQDRPEIIAIAEKSLDPDITTMAHDFLTPQPIQGARAYYLHSIIQDWDDVTNQQILRSIVPAMRKGYSKILINDYIVPDQGAHWQQTCLDWQLMVSLGARHRTDEEMRKMIDGVGSLRIAGIWKAANGLDSLIEVVLI